VDSLEFQVSNLRHLGISSVAAENLNVTETEHKSRRWQRIPLAFPVFVHGVDQDGRSTLEFGTVINVSAGGLLVALKRLPAEKDVLIEMPVSPAFYPEAPPSFRLLESTIVRTHPGKEHVYVGMQFKTPLPC
jgi:hypothetical protein